MTFQQLDKYLNQEFSPDNWSDRAVLTIKLWQSPKAIYEQPFFRQYSRWN
jgi:hypothetical protein